MKRTSRVTADVTKEAHDLLRASCLKFDCSKGKLIEKMIRKFCVDVEPNQNVAIPHRVTREEMIAVKPKRKVFTPPSFADVDEYMRTRMCPDPITQAEKFCDFYESKGWVVGKAKMKCWKAAVRNWLKGSTKAETKQIEHSNQLNDTSWANNLDDVL